MLIHSIFSDNFVEELTRSKLVLKLQLFVDIDNLDIKSITPDNEINNLLNYCYKVTDHITKFTSSMVYKYYLIGDDIKISSLLSAYNTVCELLLSSKNATKGFTDAKDLLEKAKRTLNLFSHIFNAVKVEGILFFNKL